MKNWSIVLFLIVILASITAYDIYNRGEHAGVVVSVIGLVGKAEELFSEYKEQKNLDEPIEHADFSLTEGEEEPKSFGVVNYDFYITFTDCKISGGSLLYPDETIIKITPGVPTTMGCKRSSDDVYCDFVFKDNTPSTRGNSEMYKIQLDSPPHLNFQSNLGSEYIAINTTQHTAVIVSRMVSSEVVGAKVCRGMFFTDFEAKELGK